MARDLEESKQGFIGAVQIVHGQEQWALAGYDFKQVSYRMEQAESSRLRPRKSSRHPPGVSAASLVVSVAHVEVGHFGGGSIVF